MGIKTYPSEVIELELSENKFKFVNWKHPAQGEPYFAEEMFEFIKSLINPGDVVIDIGTHVGVETIMYGLAVGKEGKVYGFEPNPYVFEPFQKTCELNKDIMNIIPVQAAITEEEGSFIFHYSDEGYCNGGFASRTDYGVGGCGHVVPIEVDCIRFDEYMKNHQEDISKIKLFKVDTEGYDLAVLKSVESILKEVKPIVQSEIFLMLSDEEIQNHLKFLDDLGYINYFMTDEMQIQIGKTDIYNLPYKTFSVENWKHAKRVFKGQNLISVHKSQFKA